MLKKFFYACAALMCLAIAFHFGATSAMGQGAGSVRFLGSTAGYSVVATSNEIWVGYNPDWKPLSYFLPPPLPVPVSEVLCIFNSTFITTSGEGYYLSGSQWVSTGIVPGGVTIARQQSFGALKAKYR